MRDIAQRLGISMATVSRALNNKPGVGEELRRRIAEEVAALDYMPNPHALGMNAKATRVIAFLIHRRQGGFAHDPFYPAILHGLEQEAAAAGYHVMVRSTTHPEEQDPSRLTLFSERRVDACVAAGPDIDRRLVISLWGAGIPCVLVDNEIEGVAVDSVKTDNRGGAYAITTHLLGHGYRDVVMLHGPLEWTSVHDRYAGYQEAMCEAGLTPRGVELPFTTISTGLEGMRHLLAGGNVPRAVVASNDVMALGAIRAVRAGGLRVPADVAVTGYDDVSIAALADLPLTTVRIHTEQLGREAARRLLIQLRARADGVLPPMSVRTLIPNEVVVRQSCGCTEGVNEGMPL